MTPVFKLNEVVVADPYQKGTGVDFGRPKYISEKVLFVGEQTTKYKVGNTVFFDYQRARQIPFNGQNLLVLPEEYITCGVEKD